MTIGMKDKLMGVTFLGNVTFNGPMFDIHDNHHVTVIQGAKPVPDAADAEDDQEYVDLKFFDDQKFATMDGQRRLRQVLRGVMSKMDVDAGRDWVVPYIAYHYYIGRTFIMKGYADFFCDIDRLMPGVLTKVNTAEKGGDKRYKLYTDSLRLECPKWFIVDECLPPMNEWTSTRFDYHVDKERRSRIQQLVREVYQGLKG